jgi:hypothetical protein
MIPTIIFGRFQPFTMSHFNMIVNSIKNYGNVFILPVQGPCAYKIIAKTDKGKISELKRKRNRNPLPVGLRIQLINNSLAGNNYNILKSDSGSIEKIYFLLKSRFPHLDFSSFNVICGPDEYPYYLQQVEDLKIKFKNVNINLKVFNNDTRDIVSGTKLRESIKNNDYETFKKLIAPNLNNVKTFNKLKLFIKN